MLAVIVIVGGNFYGIYHSFKKHSSGSGYAAMAIPPYAWYMALETLWHDDYAGVRWDARLENDVRAIAVLIGSSTKLDPSKVVDHGKAVEQLRDQITPYPKEKLTYLQHFGSLYLQYLSSFGENVIEGIELAMIEGRAIQISQGAKELALEQQLLHYRGGDKLIAEAKAGLFALNEMMKGKTGASVKRADSERMVALAAVSLKQDQRKMHDTYVAIFGKEP